MQADFGLDAELQPKLVEIQGFPTLYAYQPADGRGYREAYGMDDRSRRCCRAAYWRTSTAAVDAQRHRGPTQDPENVVLLEIDPWHQKTRHDFLLTERLLGVRTVDIAAVRKQRQPAVLRAGRRARFPFAAFTIAPSWTNWCGSQVPLAFDFRDELDVEWAGHPNWFFRLSKFSLPYLDHPAVPHTQFLDRRGRVAHPERYVLKPLYSFAGAGVIVGPTRGADRRSARGAGAASTSCRSGWISARWWIRRSAPPKSKCASCTSGWTELRPVNTIIRMGRGSQMGVDHNKGMEWVGGSAGFIDPTR